MKCPYCNEEMKKGVIQSSHEINWKPKKAKLLGNAEFHKGAVVLSELSFLKGSSVVAYNCGECKKIIIDYDKDDSKE